MGDRGASLIHHPPQYVPAHHWAGAEGSGEVHLPRPPAESAKARPEADITTIQLVGYQTSHKEIRNLYHDVYLLRRSPSSLPCRPQQRKEAIQDILSSLRSHLHRQGGTAMLEEDQWGAAGTTSWPLCQLKSQYGSRRREDLHDEALQEAREAHQLALEAAHMLEQNIERLSQGVESTQYPWPHSHSSSHPWSRSLDRHERSLDRCDRSQRWHRLERCVTFQDPEVEPVLSGRPYRGPWGHSFGIQLEGSDGVPLPIWRQEIVHPWEIPTAYPDIGSRMGYLPEPSIRNYEMWLDWQSHQLDTPHWWAELTAIPDVEDPRKLAWKTCTSFLIPVVRCEALPGQDYTMPPTPKCLTRGRFLPDDPSYQDVWWQPCYWPWLMPKHCSIRQRKLDCQPCHIIALWQWALWS